MQIQFSNKFQGLDKQQGTCPVVPVIAARAVGYWVKSMLNSMLVNKDFLIGLLMEMLADRIVKLLSTNWWIITGLLNMNVFTPDLSGRRFFNDLGHKPQVDPADTIAVYDKITVLG